MQNATTSRASQLYGNEIFFFEMPSVPHAHGKLFINITWYKNYMKKKKPKLGPW